MIIKKTTTSSDQKYHERNGKIIRAHEEGKLGKSWYTYNPKNGKMEVKPKKTFGRI